MSGAQPHPSRTWLFVPGDRPRLFAKAADSGADEVILDLEDSVVPDEKASARRHVNWWLTHGGRAWVRVNAVTTDWYARDLSMLGAAPGLRGFVIPKAEVPSALKLLERRLRPGVHLIALIETASGLQRVEELAAVDAVERLAFGSVDFAADIEATHEWDSLLLARSRLVIASRAAGKEAPIDGVTVQLGDTGRLAEETARAHRLGFGAKLCIHPEQVQIVAAAFAPDDVTLRWARDVVDAFDSAGSGAIKVGSQLVDRPVVERARRMLRAAR